MYVEGQISPFTSAFLLFPLLMRCQFITDLMNGVSVLRKQ